MEEVFTTHNIFLLGHLLGVALGAGGAFASDFSFMSSIKDGHISRTESRLLSVGSRMVWAGVLLLVLSGIGLVALRPEIFLSSEKFWAKMTVVAVIIINGIFFHTRHIPMLKRGHRKELSEDHEIIQNRVWFIVSGTISVVSWPYAIVLGILHRTPYGYAEFMLVYVLILAVAGAVALALRERIIPHA